MPVSLVPFGANWYMFTGGDAGGYNPSSGSTGAFYWGLNIGGLTGDPTTAAYAAVAANVPVARAAATIVDCHLLVATLGASASTQRGTFAIRVNNATDYVVSTDVAWSTTFFAIDTSTLSIRLQPGDFFYPKITPPVWASTNPTATFYVTQVICTTP